MRMIIFLLAFLGLVHQKQIKLSFNNSFIQFKMEAENHNDGEQQSFRKYLDGELTNLTDLTTPVYSNDEFVVFQQSQEQLYFDHKNFQNQEPLFSNKDFVVFRNPTSTVQTLLQKNQKI